MADVVLDANVLVGWLDASDVLAPTVAALASRLHADGHRVVFLDICVGEAISVVCRRARERKTQPPGVAETLAKIRGVAEQEGITFVAKEAERLLPDVLTVIEASAGLLNFNDALLVRPFLRADLGSAWCADEQIDRGGRDGID